MTKTRRSAAMTTPSRSSAERAAAGSSPTRMCITPSPPLAWAHIPSMFTPATPSASPTSAAAPGRLARAISKSVCIGMAHAA